MTQNLPKILYRERVMPGISFYLAGISLPVIATLIAIPFIDEFLWVVPVLTYGLFAIFSFVLAPVITIDQEGLTLASARIPREVIATAELIQPERAFAERGANLNAAAFVKFQVGVKGLVKMYLNDPRDATPYWLFASRNPDLVVSYLNRRS